MEDCGRGQAYALDALEPLRVDGFGGGVDELSFHAAALGYSSNPTIRIRAVGRADNPE